MDRQTFVIALLIIIVLGVLSQKGARNNTAWQGSTSSTRWQDSPAWQATWIERELEEEARKAERADVECAGGSQYHCTEAASTRLTANFKLGYNHDKLDPETYNRLSARLAR
jgi:hypothetical protein